MSFSEGIPQTSEMRERATDAEIEIALCRVVTNEDGKQTLDGYYFPPDNDEPFNPRTITYTNVGTGKTGQFESRFTNGAARRANLNLAALGYGPLFVREDDPKHIQIMKDWAERSENCRSPFRQLLNRALGWY